MTRTRWIVVFVAVGVGLAILIGVLGTRNEPSNSNSKAEAASSLCASVKTLISDVQVLTGLDPSTASSTAYSDDVASIQTDWNQVQSDYQAVKSAPPGDLENAWNSFASAVGSVSSSSSASDALNTVSQSAKQLQSAAQSTASQLSCS